MLSSFVHNERGALEIPMRLVVYLIIAAAIAATAAIGFANLIPGMAANTMERQVGEIAASLGTMQYGAARNLIDPDSPGGNMRTLKITIPDEVEYLAFGADPDPDNDGNLTNTEENLLTESGSVIFYRPRAGSKIRIPLADSIELREGLLENGRWVINSAGGKQYGVVVKGGGKYEITFELVYDPISKERYTLVHLTDNLNAYINPYDPAAVANSVWVSVDMNSIPADGVTRANVFVQLKDKRGRDAAKDGVEINLSTTLGTLSSMNLTTINGKAKANITSDSAGTAVITATSAGLNPGSTYLTITQVPIILNFNQWIYSEDEKLSKTFVTNQALRYSILFRGNGTSFSVPLLGVWWPNASIEIDGAKMGEEIIDSEPVITKVFSETALVAGNHTLDIRLKNDKSLPLIGDTNLYVESVTLY